MAEFNSFYNLKNFDNQDNLSGGINIKELSLGKKIRQLRIERKITQQELVGDFITRNMLSQIENDTATPSIKTLQYIADHLEVPLSFLMMGERDDEFTGTFEYDSAEAATSKAKKIFFEGDYLKYINIIESHPHIAAENKVASMLLGFAYLAVMAESFSNGEKDKCLIYYEKIKQFNYADTNDFIDRLIKRQAELYRLLCSPVVSETPGTPEISEMKDNQDNNNYNNYNNDYSFLKEIIDENGLCRYNLLSAHKFLKNGEPQKSVEYLKEAERIMEIIENTIKLKKSIQNAAHPYREELYKLFEKTCVQLEDYKNAHFYSSKLLNLYAEKNRI